MPEEDSGRRCHYQRCEVAGVAETVHDLTPARADPVAYGRHGTVPYEAAKEGEHSEADERHFGYSCGQSCEVPYHWDEPSPKDPPAFVASVPLFGSIEIRMGDE